MKPVKFFKTESGFQEASEGIIVEYEKGNSIAGNRIRYFILTNNDRFLDRTRNITVAIAKRNINIQSDFTWDFKTRLVELIFNTKKKYILDNINYFVEHMNDS
jgi:hypothetical protein